MHDNQTCKIFVLTLEGAEQRRAPLIRQLNDLGLEHELFMGVDGGARLPPAIEDLIDRSARITIRRRPMTDGEYACTVSHLFIHRLILDRDLPEAVILEDDARIGPAFAALARGRFRPPGDLVLLDHHKGFYRRRGEIAVTRGLTAHRVAVAPWLATGYVMRRSAARYFVGHGFPVREPADWPCDITRLSSFALYPRIVARPLDPAMHSHLSAARTRLVDLHRARMAKGVMRMFRGEYWRRRVRDWHKLRYRRLDYAVSLDAQTGPLAPGAETALHRIP